MNPGTNACIAYIAARLTSGGAALRIFDSSRDTWVRIGGIIEPRRVALYDYDRMGSINGPLSLVRDACAGISFSLLVEGEEFSAWSAAADRRVRGHVRGLDVDLEDSRSRRCAYRLDALSY